MKSNICLWLTSLSLLLVSITESKACGPGDYYPYGYKMFRVYDAKAGKQSDQATRNCILWQKLTSSDIPLSDIRQVVYKYTLDQMGALMSVNSKNAFASWIKKNNDTEIYDFLILAKICEKTRGSMLDPWYYPSKNDGTYLSLNEIEEAAKAYEGTRLKDRYALQAIRAMFSAKKYQEIIDYWYTVADSLPEGLIKDMSIDYVLGAYSRVNKIDEALEFFTQRGDLSSIMNCMYSKGQIRGTADRLECINRYAPDSPQIPQILQEAISSLEPKGDCDYSYKYRRDNSLVVEYPNYGSSQERKSRYDEIYSLAIRMTRNPSSDKAVWYYTAAFLADLDAKPDEAWEHIQNASRYPASQFLKESIRVMKMYLDAKVSDYDAAYEARLYKDLQWLDKKITGNVTKSIRNELETWGWYTMRNNISLYYWNDMMRRILLAEVCPRMIDRGMTIRALQLANMADNRLMIHVDTVMIGYNYGRKTFSEYRASTDYNSYDYSSCFFNTMQELPIEELEAYITKGLSRGSAFDVFLNKRGYTDRDYLYDILGTGFIRCHDYKNAVKYLSEVSDEYQERLNTDEYMYSDPFSMRMDYLYNRSRYKLKFAEEMVKLEETIGSVADNSIRGLTMIRYATGMYNSHTSCWPLTAYKKHSLGKNTLLADIKKGTEDIINQGLSIIEEPEMAAIAHARLYQWKTAVEKYPDTYAARYTVMCCDNLCDYSISYLLDSID